MRLAKAVNQVQPSYIREILSAATDPKIISMAGGLPDDNTFPIKLMADSLMNLTQRPELFQYGNTQGYQPLLDYLKNQYALPDSHDGIVCTGSQQGLDLIARAFINPGDTIVMEAPSYLGAIQVFGLAQANIESVTQTLDGPDISELKRIFETNWVKLFYAVPDFHNPTGVCWTNDTRLRVAELCKEHNVTLIEDVPYRELRFNGENLPLVSSYCPENAIVLRSFSKVATPGIRLGFLSTKKEWLSPLVKVKQASDLHSSIPMQAVLLDLLSNNQFENHLCELKKQYRVRYKLLEEKALKYLPESCQFERVDGGMFIWLTLPKCNVNELARVALEKGLAVVPSSVFYNEPNNKPAALRLNFTNANDSQIDKAMQILANTFKELNIA